MPRLPHIALLLAVLACATALACDGSGGSSSAPVEIVPTSTTVAEGEPAPVLCLRILGVDGASGAGFFRPGDRMGVVFRLEHEDGSPWALAEMSDGFALVSGPTFRYQRVLPPVGDVVTRGVQRPDGSIRYELPTALPDVYAPPANDTASFGVSDGELTGEALLDGTYTLGLSFVWGYTVAGEAFRQVAEGTFDFPVGDGAGALRPRAVTSQQNCERCHLELTAHAGRHRSLGVCLLCHTVGSEDLNDPAIEGGTPGMTVDSRVLFHKLHSGRALPSVQGIGVNPDGTRDFGAGPRPYRLVGADGAVHDFSERGFPAFPSRSQPMPRDQNWSSLTAEQRAQDLATRQGISSCFVCHGDPDGDGPIEAPEQGDLINSQASRLACGACHDDVDWTQFYFVNGGMPPQLDDSGCAACHVEFENEIQTERAHVHPLRDPAFDQGLVVELVDAVEAGDHDDDGSFDAGERIELVLDLRDREGAPVDPQGLASLEVVLSGPTSNLNLVHAVKVPSALLEGPPPYRVRVPRRIEREFVGNASARLGDTGATRFAPHADVPGAETDVEVRTGLIGAPTTLAAHAPAGRTFVDVAVPGGFERGSVVVIDDGVPGREEYRTLAFVQDERLFFEAVDQPALANALEHDHAAGASVARVALEAKVEGVDYLLDPATGMLLELQEFGAGNAVLVSYTTELELPGVYPPPLNESAVLGESAGEWAGKPLVSGTYRLAVAAYRELVLEVRLETNVYASASAPAYRDVLVGDALLEEPYDSIDSGQACNSCHQDLSFHSGAYRGFDTCLACHGTAGAEDLTRARAANAPPTPGVTVSFRTLLHAIHRGRDRFDPSALQVVGEGPAPYPDNFEVASYDTLRFPADPGATQQCERCHGQGNTAWQLPASRNHPAGQAADALVWRAVCAACHDAPAALGHIELMTTPGGVETCAVCHGLNEPDSVERAHFARRR